MDVAISYKGGIIFIEAKYLARVNLRGIQGTLVLKQLVKSTSEWNE
jgi:hypothetical protein